ncbi:hypothetical protein PCANC_23015 [Puccinia coronata f. sp. avenae]|uniref:BED-type domain-containing protein n=1 Tax=Puccinia coronata f. sp. avenae TaxID=200324 RepID=A0A2N5SGY7_9BASI|nr:hypothetical protein PCANC_23015 [Puccinia coronata f. sp. avenae]
MVSDDSDHNHDTPATDAALSQELSDEQELAKARKVHKNQVSSCYAFYHPPELSNKLDKHKQRKMAYSCKQCGTKIHCPSYDTSPSNLSKHVAACSKKQQEAKETQKLAALGITGTQDVDPQEVPQLCAICAAVLDQNPRGAMYLGINAWQSPNGYDVLGTVIYRLIEDDSGGIELEAMPLDFVRLKQSHTGVYLADTVRVIVEMFGVQNKVIMRPFGTQKNNKANNNLSQQEGLDNKNNEADADEQIQAFTKESNEESDNEGVDDETLATNLVDGEGIELEENDVNDLSNEDKDNCYTSDSCRQTLAKF